VGSERFELSTLCSGGIRSIQLSYEPDEEATFILTCPPRLRHRRRSSGQTKKIFQSPFERVLMSWASFSISSAFLTSIKFSTLLESVLSASAFNSVTRSYNF
jgi:hypothetical protein